MTKSARLPRSKRTVVAIGQASKRVVRNTAAYKVDRTRRNATRTAETVIASHLQRVAEVSAVFVMRSDGHLHIFTVIREHRSSSYDRILRKERAIESALRGVELSFSVRAHQGRDPASVVPSSCKLIFRR
jgi:hypothetical protein